MNPVFSLRGKRVFVAGHRGMVGAALVRQLNSRGAEVVTAPRERVDLRNADATRQFLADTRPAAVVMAAAKVGGILANDAFPVDFLLENLNIQNSVFAAAHAADVEKLLFLGSSCIYPKFAPQPISEDALLTSALEPTNEPYAIAKIAGIKLADAYRKQYGSDFISAMPCNLYGPGDNWGLTSSHVVPALIHKAHIAKVEGRDHIEIWGSGSPRREFLHVDDCAAGLTFLLEHWSGAGHVNVGSGEDVTITELAQLVMKAVGFRGALTHDLSKPDGTPRKLMDVSRIKAIGWAPAIDLAAGLAASYQAFLTESRGKAA
ncbi:MAG: GDP-L-fucose synthase family protein [Caulobacterales bacterium]|jgi:GDP-L-fucose synthase